MSIEHIEVNGHELTAFDLPPEPSDTYHVWVDGLGEILVEKGKPPKEKDIPSMYMRKLVPDLCEQNAELHRENAKLRESVRNLLICVKHEECEESCPNYEPMYTDYGYEKNGSTVVESEYLGCCTVGLENCNSTLFDTDEYLRELRIEVEDD